MGLSLTVLGCTGSWPGPDGACSGYLVRSGSTTVMIDAGPGTAANLQRHVPLDAVDAVVLTHRHPDHWSDLGVIRTAWKHGFGVEGRPVYGTAETKVAADHLVGGSLSPTIDWRVIAAGDEVHQGDLSLRFSRTDHDVETLAVGIESGGRRLAYSADTGPAWSFTGLGSGFDAALCESSVSDRDAAPDLRHLTPEEAGERAREAGAARLFLTHLTPGSDAGAHLRRAEAVFGGPVVVVGVHDTYEI